MLTVFPRIRNREPNRRTIKGSHSRCAESQRLTSDNAPEPFRLTGDSLPVVQWLVLSREFPTGAGQLALTPRRAQRTSSSNPFRLALFYGAGAGLAATEELTAHLQLVQISTGLLRMQTFWRIFSNNLQAMAKSRFASLTRPVCNAASPPWKACASAQ